MRRSFLFAVGGLTLLVGGPAVAQEFKPTANLFGQQKTPAPKPPQVDWNWRPPADTAAGSKTTVVCGMTLVAADPKVDPGMRVTVPSSGVTYTLRSVPPEICKAR
jgi:hypothetical protein